LRIGIGIDTGGTYTDAVAYDFDAGAVLGAAKSLTTKEDLSVGILGALDSLPGGILREAGLISLSTTLATNACVEDRGGRAKLAFFGGNADIINDVGGPYGLPRADEIYIQECLTDLSGDIEREPDWELFEKKVSGGLFDGCCGAAVIEMNAMKNGAVIERKARDALRSCRGIPVICGHELTNKLNCLQRASGALLNARLFPVIQEFLSAIKKAMDTRGIKASIVIVRSDGSLMSDEFAHLRPVETLLCGPAASALGGTMLAGGDDGVIIDMGGTTTDIAFVKNRTPVNVRDGISVGKWRTFVNGLYVKTFGLGGDSAVHFSDGNMVLEDYRVVPLCAAAKRYPHVKDNLELIRHGDKHTRQLHEHYMLVKRADAASYTREEINLCAALENGPLTIKETASAIGGDVYTVDRAAARLVREGTVIKCGFTPTDVMHIRGDFKEYSDEAAIYAAEYVAANLDTDVEGLCDKVYDEVKRKLYLNTVRALLENKNPYYMKQRDNREIDQFIAESYEGRKSDGEALNILLGTSFGIIGLGAPTHIFIHDIAERLGTEAVIPKHANVANALGAVSGNVYAVRTIAISPNYSPAGITGYTVSGNRESRTFRGFEEAREFALSEACEGAREEAVNRGATGEITVTSDVINNVALARNAKVDLGSAVTARASGSYNYGAK